MHGNVLYSLMMYPLVCRISQINQLTTITDLSCDTYIIDVINELMLTQF